MHLVASTMSTYATGPEEGSHRLREAIDTARFVFASL